MKEDTIQDIIRDAHALAQWTGDADLIQSGAETIARRLERLVKHGLPDSETPSSESNADSFGKILAVKWLGIEFRRFRSNAETVYVATWRNDETRDSHVYEIHVKRDGDTPNCGFIAQATNDGRRVFSLSAKNRSHCELCALSAMKRYLSRGHRGPYRKRMAAAAAKEVA